MKKLLLVIAVAVFATTTFLSCKDSNPVERIVSLYRDGKITQDSLLIYASDSTNYNKIVEWAKANSDKDNIAAWLLGRSYKYGTGVDENLDMAKIYYIKAANGKLPIAMRELGDLYGYRLENADSAMYWYMKGGEAGDGDCYIQACGVMFLRRGVDLSSDACLEMLKKGAALKSTRCIEGLAYHYFDNGDKGEAFNLLISISEEKLDSYALNILAEIYEEGCLIGSRGLDPSFNDAYRLFKKAADKYKWDVYSHYKVGCYLLLGQGVEQNDSLAFIEFRKAANNGGAEGMRGIAYCYETGHGVARDADKANMWYILAAQNGDSTSIKHCKRHNIDYKQYKANSFPITSDLLAQ